jgi:uracil-DNA glycosylase
VDELRPLLEEISQCPIAIAIQAGKLSSIHPCHKIVKLQKASAFQLPEPWSGKIDTAPVLFISSNPSIDEREEYPDQSWRLDRTIDFFQNRFTSDAGWVRDGLYVLQRDGSLSRQWVRFWAAARGRTCEILDKGKSQIKPGIDFALTEIVHCKSREEEGVKEARDFCSERYLERILSVAAAKVLVVFGGTAKHAIVRLFGPAMTLQSHDLNIVSIQNVPRMVVFLPHPNERGSMKTLRANIGDGALLLIRGHVNGKPKP